MIKRADTIVVGTGIAGMMFALEMAESGSVIMLTKRGADVNNTALAGHVHVGDWAILSGYTLVHHFLLFHPLL